MKNLMNGELVLSLMTVILCFTFSPSFAQQEPLEIGKIRAIYQQTNERIEQAARNFPESEVFYSELIVNKGGTMYPAVGIFKSVSSLYYTYGDREKDPYPSRLMKAVVATERAASQEYAEFLFDESGKLVFYFEKMNDSPESEMRLYYSNGKVVRIQRGNKIVNLRDREGSAAVKSAQAQADRIVQIFRNSIS